MAKRMHSARKQLRDNRKIAVLVLLIAVQVVLAVVMAILNPTTSQVPSIFLVAGALVLIAGLREIIRDVTGPGSAREREVNSNGALLDLISVKLPLLMGELTTAALNNTNGADTRLAGLRPKVLHEAIQLAPNESARAAYFTYTGEQFDAASDHMGWDSRPVCPTRALGGLIFETLEDRACEKVWCAVVDDERSVTTLAFKLSDRCRSFVAVPVRSTGGLAGFLYLECEKKNALGPRSAAALVVLSQILCAAETFRIQQRRPPKGPPTNSVLPGGAQPSGPEPQISPLGDGVDPRTNPGTGPSPRQTGNADGS